MNWVSGNTNVLKFETSPKSKSRINVPDDSVFKGEDDCEVVAADDDTRKAAEEEEEGEGDDECEVHGK